MNKMDEGKNGGRGSKNKMEVKNRMKNKRTRQRWKRKLQELGKVVGGEGEEKACVKKEKG